MLACVWERCPRPDRRLRRHSSPPPADHPIVDPSWLEHLDIETTLPQGAKRGIGRATASSPLRPSLSLFCFRHSGHGSPFAASSLDLMAGLSERGHGSHAAYAVTSSRPRNADGNRIRSAFRATTRPAMRSASPRYRERASVQWSNSRQLWRRTRGADRRGLRAMMVPSKRRVVPSCPVRMSRPGEPRLLAYERECQAGNHKGSEKDRQNALSGASKGDDFALGGVERPSSAGVSAAADLQGVMSRRDWRLERVVQIDCPDPLDVDHDVVRATTDLHRLLYASASVLPAS